MDLEFSVEQFSTPSRRRLPTVWILPMSGRDTATSQTSALRSGDPGTGGKGTQSPRPAARACAALMGVDTVMKDLTESFRAFVFTQAGQVDKAARTILQSFGDCQYRPCPTMTSSVAYKEGGPREPEKG